MIGYIKPKDYVQAIFIDMQNLSETITETVLVNSKEQLGQRA